MTGYTVGGNNCGDQLQARHPWLVYECIAVEVSDTVAKLVNSPNATCSFVSLLRFLRTSVVLHDAVSSL